MKTPTSRIKNQRFMTTQKSAKEIKPDMPDVKNMTPGTEVKKNKIPAKGKVKSKAVKAKKLKKGY